MPVKTLFVFAALCAATASARAQGNPAILAVNQSVSLSYLLSKMYYLEPDDGSIGQGYLDSERGNLKGGRAAVSYMTPEDQYYLHAEWSGAEAKVDYAGYYLTIPPTPTNQKSRATTQEFGFKLGRGWNLGEDWLATPYLTGGRRYWVRELGLGTRGDYVESYNFSYIGFGSLIQYSPHERWVFTGDATIGKTMDPSIHVPTVGLNHTALGAAPIIKLGLEVDYRTISFLHLFAGFDYTYFTFGQSGVQRSGFLEPFSRTELYNYTIGLRWTN